MAQPPVITIAQFQNAGLDPDTNGVLLSVVDAAGREVWLRIPHTLVGAVTSGLLKSAQAAAEHASGEATLAEIVQKNFGDLKVSEHWLLVDDARTHCRLDLRTQAGLSISVHIPATDVQKLADSFQHTADVLAGKAKPGS